jgi:hypothetical protein
VQTAVISANRSAMQALSQGRFQESWAYLK